jgi:hypothetical protein
LLARSRGTVGPSDPKDLDADFRRGRGARRSFHRRRKLPSFLGEHGTYVWAAAKRRGIEARGDRATNCRSRAVSRVRGKDHSGAITLPINSTPAHSSANPPPEN